MGKWTRPVGLLVVCASSAAADTPSIDDVLAAGRAARSELMRRLDRARVEGDATGAACFDQKLSCVDAAIRPLELGSIERMPPRFLAVTLDRIATLLREARGRCVARTSTRAGPNSREVVVDPRIPREDPSVFPPRR